MKYTKASGSLPLTKIRIASLAELPATPEAEIKGLFICLPQLVATLDGCKCLLSIAVSDEAVVVTGEEDEARLGCLSTCHGEEIIPRVQRDWGGSSHSPNDQPSDCGSQGIILHCLAHQSKKKTQSITVDEWDRKDILTLGPKLTLGHGSGLCTPQSLRKQRTSVSVLT